MLNKIKVRLWYERPYCFLTMKRSGLGTLINEATKQLFSLFTYQGLRFATSFGQQ